MISRVLRNHRLFYLLCVALLVVALSGTSKVAQAAGVTISISQVNGIQATCNGAGGNARILVNYTVSVNVPTGSSLILRVSVSAPGFSSDNLSGLFPPAGFQYDGPYSNSKSTFVSRTYGSSIPANSLFTITYYNGIGSGGDTIQINCSTGALVGGANVSAFNITHFDPADGRIDGKPADRIVIYCNPTATPPSIDIYGIANDGTGFFLARFKFSLVVRSGKRGVLLRPVGKGKISLLVDANNNFYAAWNGGPYNANGQGDFAKSFTCPFSR